MSFYCRIHSRISDGNLTIYKSFSLENMSSVSPLTRTWEFSEGKDPWKRSSLCPATRYVLAKCAKQNRLRRVLLYCCYSAKTSKMAPEPNYECKYTDRDLGMGNAHPHICIQKHIRIETFTMTKEAFHISWEMLDSSINGVKTTACSYDIRN